jgi:predicted DNA-binding transcriptional regulator AlpA
MLFDQYRAFLSNNTRRNMLELAKSTRLARPKQAAAHLSISRSTLWAWAKTRKGFPRPIKLGERTTVFDLNAIDAFVTAQGATK